MRKILRWIIEGYVTIDVFLIENYERFIGDPLQKRGISLNTQRRTAFLVLAVTSFFPIHAWIQALSSAYWLYLAFFSVLPDLDPPPDDVLTINKRKITLRHFMGRMVNYTLSVFLLAALIVSADFQVDLLLFNVAFLLYPVIEACDPKPPAPKRIKVLKPAMDSV